MANVLSLTETDAASRVQLIGRATEIFFETANTKAFESQSVRDAFYQRWFGHYLDADPASFLLALDENGAVIGYLASCLDSFSEAARIIIGDISFYTPCFCSALRSYPTHFHINVKPGYQGQGVGRFVLTHFFQLCQDRGSPGVHVVTDPKSRAENFYRMRGFKPVAIPEADPGLAVLVYALRQ